MKLYQPVHGRYSLVLASLCCVLPGLPEHAVEPASETVGFVVRREGPGGEEAWVPTDPGRGAWRPLDATGDQLSPGEELVQMFCLPWMDGDRRRRIWAGVLPTSGRELWSDTGAVATSDGPALSGWVHGLDVAVLGLVRTLTTAKQRLHERDAELLDGELLEAARRERALPSAWCLWELLELLRLNWKTQHGHVASGATANLRDPLEALLAGWQVPTAPEGSTSAWEALAWVAHHKGDLERPDPPDEALRFDLGSMELATAAGLVEALQALVPSGETGAFLPMDRPRLGADQRYRVRCVYSRPDRCCGPTQILSLPSPIFQIAALYDPAAPTRDVRIPLPSDISIAALRSFKKNVSFPFSAELNKKANQVSDLGKLIKGESGDGGIGIGFICSLSIPTITICASLVLMLFLGLFNIAFFWMPFIRICIPYPKSKGA